MLVRRHAVNKANIRAARNAIGPGASIEDVAVALRVNPIYIMRRLTTAERQEWVLEVRTRDATAKATAIRRIRARTFRDGKRPTARTSGVHTSVMNAHGGFLQLCREAGCLPPRR